MTGTVLVILALLFAAMVLLVLEIITPTFGVLAGMAVAAAGGAVWLSFTISHTTGVVVLVLVGIGLPAYCICLVKWLPRTSLTRRLFLREAEPGTGEATPEADQLKRLVGKTGTAETPLRPSGAVRIDGSRVSAVAESGMIARGATVRVIKARGSEVVVRPTGKWCK